MVQWLEFLPVGPIKQPPFWLWLGYNMTMSAITMTDVVTQGFFLASSLRMFTCQGKGPVRNQVCSESLEAPTP